jgi:hypothetical protein
MSEVAQHISEKGPTHHYSPTSSGCEVKMQLSCNNSQKTENRCGDLAGIAEAASGNIHRPSCSDGCSAFHRRVILLLSLKYRMNTASQIPGHLRRDDVGHDKAGENESKGLAALALQRATSRARGWAPAISARRRCLESARWRFEA